MQKLLSNDGKFLKKETPKQRGTNYSDYLKEVAVQAGKGNSTKNIEKQFNADEKKRENNEIAPLKKSIEEAKIQQKLAEKEVKELENNKGLYTSNFKQEYKGKVSKEINELSETKNIIEDDIQNTCDKIVKQEIRLIEKGIDLDINLIPIVLKTFFTLLCVMFCYLGFEIPNLILSIEYLLYIEAYKATSLALGIGILALACSHFSGIFLYKQKKKSAFIWIVLGMSINVATIITRYLIEGGFTETFWIITILILTAFWINIGVSKHTCPKLNLIFLLKPYKALLREIRKKGKELIRIKARISAINNGEKDYADSKYHTELLKQKQNIQTQQVIISNANHTIKNIKNEYKRSKKAGIAKIRKVAKNTHKRRLKFLKTACFSFIVGTSILCSSCEQEPPKILNFGVSIDVSKSQNKDSINPEALFNFLWRKIDLDTVGFENRGISVMINSIGRKITPELTCIQLVSKKGNAFFGHRKKRHKEIESFKKNLFEAINAIAKIPRTQNKTNIWLPLHSMLHQFNNDADINQVYIISDFISDNNFLSLNAKEYKKNPGKIIHDYEELSTKLLKVATFPKDKIENLEIVLVKKVQNQQDEQLAYFSAKFFERFFNTQGIEVSVRGQL